MIETDSILRGGSIGKSNNGSFLARQIPDAMDTALKRLRGF